MIVLWGFQVICIFPFISSISLHSLNYHLLCSIEELKLHLFISIEASATFKDVLQLKTA